MSGPSSSDLITRRKFLITERTDPLPCCAPGPIRIIATLDVSANITEDEFTSIVLNPNPTTLTVTTLNPVYVTALANSTGASGDVIQMKVVYTIDASPTEYTAIAATPVTIPASGNATVYATGTFTPPSQATYTFYLQLNQTTGSGAVCNNATLYAQGT
jgi:hypothetical protein